MPTSNARSAAGSQIPDGTRGPEDDFFCHKYQVWYRIEDCVYRGRNKTFAGCVNCFQGFLNIRSLERGIKPPAFLGLHAPAKTGTDGPAQPLALDGQGAILPFASPSRDPRNGTNGKDA